MAATVSAPTLARIGDDAACHARDARSCRVVHRTPMPPAMVKAGNTTPREGAEISDAFTFVARQAARPPSSCSAAGAVTKPSPAHNTVAHTKHGSMVQLLVSYRLQLLHARPVSAARFLPPLSISNFQFPCEEMELDGSS